MQPPSPQTMVPPHSPRSWHVGAAGWWGKTVVGIGTTHENERIMGLGSAVYISMETSPSHCAEESLKMSCTVHLDRQAQ